MEWAKEDYEGLRGLEMQKEFAQAALQLSWSAALFAKRKGEDMLPVVARTSADRLLELSAAE